MLAYPKVLQEGVLTQFSWEPFCISATLQSETSYKSMKNARAVYDVILYRMQKRQQTACEVVLAPHQFTNMTMKKIQRVDRKGLTMLELVDNMPPECESCEWFHTESIKPAYTYKLKVVKRVGGHVYYRRK